MNWQYHSFGTWKETDVTALLLRHASPEIEVYPFTGPQEGKLGADWLWWWIDRSRDCFGLLSQAKSLKKTKSGRYSLDLRYQGATAGQTQTTLLLDTAAFLGVPAAHVLYCGDAAFRAQLECGRDHPSGHSCRQRDRAGVSIIASLAANNYRHNRDHAELTYCMSMPLEEVANPLSPDGNIVVPSGRELPDEVRRFLANPQSGARRIAKALLRPVAQIRMGQFSPAVMDRALDLDSEMAFSRLPTDRGHFGEPYLPHVLRGLRREIPDYVLNLRRGVMPGPELTDRLAGIVVVELPETGGEYGSRPPLRVLTAEAPSGGPMMPAVSGTVPPQTPLGFPVAAALVRPQRSDSPPAS